MPWEKSFNEEEALENAMKVFWEKGFETASITDLIEGTGVNRGSLYNAFGGKQPLFVKSLLKYDQTRQTMLAELEAMDDPKSAIHTFFNTLVTTAVADKKHKGCFLFNTALEIATHDETVNEIVINGVNQIEAFFRRSVEVGQARGDIRTDLDPAATAKTLLALVVAIRVLGRGVYAEAALQTIADQAKQIIA